MWGWIAALLASSRHTPDGAAVELAAFVVIAIGAAGCVWAGIASDRCESSPLRVKQRARVTIIAMGVSGACCLVAALVFDSFPLLLAVSLVWGVAVIADSAQFSAIVSDVADPRYVGTALALQTAAIAQNGNWRWATAAMALGPLLGIWAMNKLCACVME